MSGRRTFPLRFKLQVLNSYRQDADCRGNQRATARKHGIHRRQIQKWLQMEHYLRAAQQEIPPTGVVDASSSVDSDEAIDLSLSSAKTNNWKHAKLIPRRADIATDSVTFNTASLTNVSCSKIKEEIVSDNSTDSVTFHTGSLTNVACSKIKEEIVSDHDDSQNKLRDPELMSSLRQQDNFLEHALSKRRSFSLQFKINVLDSFYGDTFCRGNQRATARKYGINRRQVQKWLRQELQLRSEATVGGGLQRQRLGKWYVGYNEDGSHDEENNFSVVSPSNDKACANNKSCDLDGRSATSKTGVSVLREDIQKQLLFQERKRKFIPSLMTNAQIKKTKMSEVHVLESGSDGADSGVCVDDIQDAPLCLVKVERNGGLDSDPMGKIESEHTDSVLQSNKSLGCSVFSKPSSTTGHYDHKTFGLFHSPSSRLEVAMFPFQNLLGLCSKGTVFGQRHAYPLEFKIQALDAYHVDAECAGNQRAVAKKFRVHRRQIQKWLKQEEQLRQRATQLPSSGLVNMIR